MVFCEMVILVVFKGFLLVKNLEILIQIVLDSPIYYYSHSGRRTLKLTVSHEEINGINWFWCVHINSGKLKVTLII